MFHWLIYFWLYKKKCMCKNRYISRLIWFHGINLMNLLCSSDLFEIKLFDGCLNGLFCIIHPSDESWIYTGGRNSNWTCSTLEYLCTSLADGRGFVRYACSLQIFRDKLCAELLEEDHWRLLAEDALTKHLFLHFEWIEGNLSPFRKYLSLLVVYVIHIDAHYNLLLSLNLK